MKGQVLAKELNKTRFDRKRVDQFKDNFLK